MAQQKWDPDSYEKKAGFVAALARDIITWADVQPGERVFDVGCGDGRLSAELAAKGASVVAVDSSPEMVAAACRRGIDARLADACDLDFDGEFDVAFSNAVLHWIDDQPAALRSIRRALKPGGRFVAELGGRGNMVAAETALRAVLCRRGVLPPSPWFFPGEQEYAGLLHAAGFAAERIESVWRPTLLDAGMDGWLETFGSPYLCLLATEDQAGAVEETLELLKPVLLDQTGRWWADYVRLRFVVLAA